MPSGCTPDPAGASVRIEVNFGKNPWYFHVYIWDYHRQKAAVNFFKSVPGLKTDYIPQNVAPAEVPADVAVLEPRCNPLGILAHGVSRERDVVAQSN